LLSKETRFYDFGLADKTIVTIQLAWHTDGVIIVFTHKKENSAIIVSRKDDILRNVGNQTVHVKYYRNILF